MQILDNPVQRVKKIFKNIFGKTVMNSLQEANLASIAIGKISDIFDGEGVTKAIRTVSNMDGMDKFINILGSSNSGR